MQTCPHVEKSQEWMYMYLMGRCLHLIAFGQYQHANTPTCGEITRIDVFNGPMPASNCVWTGGRQEKGKSSKNMATLPYPYIMYILVSYGLYAPVHRKSILDIIRGQNQVRVTKVHEVQIFKMCNFELLGTEKVF